MSWAITAAKTMAVGVAGDPPVAPHQRLDQCLEPGGPGLLEHLAQQLEGRRRDGIGHVDAGHVLDPGPAVGRGPGHAGHQAVVELEDRAGQAGPVEGEIGALRASAMCPPSARSASGCAVARIPSQCGQRLGQRADVVRVALDGDHAAGPMVGRQDQRRRGQPVGAVIPLRPAPGRPWPRPRSPRGRSRRCWPPSSIWRAVAVVASGTPAPAA